MKQTLTLTCGILTVALMTGTVGADIVETSFQQGASPAVGYNSGVCLIGSGNSAHSTNLNNKELYVGWAGANYGEARIVFEFDLNEISGRTVTDVELVLSSPSKTGTDASITVDLLALSEDFDETTVTWNSLTPDGGSLAGDLLSSESFVAYSGWQPSGGRPITFASSANFVAAANAALAAGDKTLRFIARTTGVEDGSPFVWFYHDEDTATEWRPKLIVTSTPEPATMGLLGLGFAGMAALRRRRRRA